MQLKFSAGIMALVIMLSCSSQQNMMKQQTAQLKRIAERVREKGGLTAGPEKEKHLNLVTIWKGEGRREQFIQDYIREYRFENQDVHVKHCFSEDIPGLAEFETGIRGQALNLYIADMIKKDRYRWDVIPMTSGEMYREIGDYLNDPDWGHKYLVNFNDVPGYAETQVASVVKNNAFRDAYDGIALGPFIEGWVELCFYNRELTDKMGIEIKSRGMTIDDFIGYVRAIDAYNKAHHTQYAAIYDASDWVTLAAFWRYLHKSAIGYNGSYEMPEHYNARLQAGFRKCVRALAQLGQYRPLIESAAENKWSETRHLVLEDEAVFYFNGSWMPNLWEAIDREKCRKMMPAELPVFESIEHYPGSFQSNMAVLKQAPNKEAAVEFFLQMANPDAAEDWVSQAKSPTGLKRHLSGNQIGGDAYHEFMSYISTHYDGQITEVYPACFGSRSGISFDQNDIHRLLRGDVAADEIIEKYEKQVRIKG